MSVEIREMMAAIRKAEQEIQEVYRWLNGDRKSLQRIFRKTVLAIVFDQPSEPLSVTGNGMPKLVDYQAFHHWSHSACPPSDDDQNLVNGPLTRYIQIDGSCIGPTGPHGETPPFPETRARLVQRLA